MVSRYGILFVAITATLSIVACSSLLVWIVFMFFKPQKGGEEYLSRIRFLKTQFGSLFISLLFADLLQAIGFSLNYHWFRLHGTVQSSTTICNVQASAIEIGDVCSALSSLTIAIHTMLILLVKYKPPRYTIWLSITVNWLSAAILTFIGPVSLQTEEKGSFFANAGAWCWISPQYESYRFTLHYLWVFISAFGSIVLYTLIFLHLRGYRPQILDRLQAWFHPDQNSSEGSNHGHEKKGGFIIGDQRVHAMPLLQKMARKMIGYPIAYIICCLPLSIYRLAGIAGHDWPVDVLLACGCVYTLSGVVDTLLFGFTRNILTPPRLPFPHRRMCAVKDNPLHSRSVSNGIVIYQTHSQTIEVLDPSHSPLTASEPYPRTRGMLSLLVPSSAFSHSTEKVAIEPLPMMRGRDEEERIEEFGLSLQMTRLTEEETNSDWDGKSTRSGIEK